MSRNRELTPSLRALLDSDRSLSELEYHLLLGRGSLEGLFGAPSDPRMWTMMVNLMLIALVRLIPFFAYNSASETD